MSRRTSIRIRVGMALLLALLAAPARAEVDPVKDYPELDYINITQALLHLDKLRPDNDDYLDAYAMSVHCDVVAGSYRDEFRWKRAREAIKEYVKLKKKFLPTRLGVRSQIMFTRYDFDSKYFLFSPETQLAKVNTFTSNARTNSPGCTGVQTKLMPSYYMVVTNNPVNLPGLRLTEEEARDLAQKFSEQLNTRRVVWIRFLIDIVDAPIIGPSMVANRGIGDNRMLVKATLYGIEFFSDPYYRNRFYIWYPF